MQIPLSQEVIRGLNQHVYGSQSNPNLDCEQFPILTQLANSLMSLNVYVDISEVQVSTKNKDSQDPRFISEGVTLTASNTDTNESGQSKRLRLADFFITNQTEPEKGDNDKYFTLTADQLTMEELTLIAAVCPEIDLRDYWNRNAKEGGECDWSKLKVIFDLSKKPIMTTPYLNAQYLMLCTKFHEMEFTGFVKGRSQIEDAKYLVALNTFALKALKQITTIFVNDGTGNKIVTMSELSAMVENSTATAQPVNQ